MDIKILKNALGYCLVLALMVTTTSANSQALLNKVKQKAEQAAEKAIDKKLAGKQTNAPATGSGSTSGSGETTDGTESAGRPANNSGGGLISTPPNVNENLAEAEAAYNTKSYADARYAVQQAMLGVEMEIGTKVLNSLPENVSGLPADKANDQVTSTGYGWAGLTLQREYQKDDKQLRVTVANNSAWMSAYNMYLANSGYAQTTGGQQNWKQVRVKGYKGIIEYNDGSGYKLSIALGQSSLLVWEGINFATEPDMMKAAETFDIDAIKKQLGEQ